MSAHEHFRTKIVTALQHPYKHSLSDFIFSHDALPPDIVNLEQAMGWLFDIVYPKVQEGVADYASLPLIGNSLGDQRNVYDDGDGKSAMYMWAQYDGEATPSWHKIMDIDWSSDGILAQLQDRTQPYFVLKNGADDYDETGTVISGLLAGQAIYGGMSANTNLTLFANNGDATGNSGYIQLGDHTRPLVDSFFNLGTDTERFLSGYFDTLYAGTASISSGSVTDSSGSISFDNENLLTTGTLDSGTHTIDTLILSAGSITDTSGSIDLGGTDVTTTGDGTFAVLTADSATIDGDISISSSSITSISNSISFGDAELTTTSSLNSGNDNIFGTSLIAEVYISGTTILSNTLDADLILGTTGNGFINIISPMITDNVTTIGDVDITGSLIVDSIQIDGQVISTLLGATLELSSDSIISIATPLLLPDLDDSTDIGSSLFRFKDIYLSSGLNTDTYFFDIDDLMALRNANYRDTARTLPVQVGDCLFWTGIEWLASNPDTEIDHTELTGLTSGDAGHTQFAMLSGRTLGQTIYGGTATPEVLNLISNTTISNGLSIDETSFKPIITDTYSIGSSLLKFDDLYMIGEAFGLRTENDTLTGISAKCSANTKGRLFFDTDSDFVYVDIGGSPKKIGQNTYNAVHTQAEVEGGAIDVTTGTDIIDARNCIWQLKDITNNDEILHVVITSSSTHVTIVTEVDLPSGNYRLLGIEV
jgi:hypothetical protein